MIAAWSITLKEIARKRVVLLTLLLTAAFLIVFYFGVNALTTEAVAEAGPTAESVVQIMTASALCLAIGFFFANFVVAYLIIFSSAGAISADVESGLLLAVLPRPIRRSAWYVGRWLGCVTWSLLYSVLLSGAIVWIVQLHLPLPIDAEAAFRALVVYALFVISLVTLTLLGSTYLPTLGNGVVVALLFGFGTLGGLLSRIGMVERIQSSTEELFRNLELYISLVIPTDALYRRMTHEFYGFILIDADYAQDALGPFANPSVPSDWYLLYSLVYTAALLFWGARRFSRKDI